MEVIRFISYVFMDLIMISVMIFCFGKMSLNKPKLNTLKIIGIIVLSSLNILNNLYAPINYKLIVAFLIAIFINKIPFNLKYKDTTIYTAFYLIITYILEILLSYLLVLLNISTLEILNNTIIIKYLISIIHSILTIMIFKIKKITELLFKVHNMIANNILLFLIMMVFILNIITIFRCYTSNLFSLINIILIFIVLSLYIVINDKYNINILKDKNKNLKDSYKAYSNTIEECRELKHNLKNDLFSIKSLLPIENQKIVNDLIIKYNKNYEWINKIEEIPEGLQGIIFLKQNEALEKKIKIYINTTKKIDTSNDDYINISSILGILLDNAIEASITSKKKIIAVSITETKNILNIEIINKYNNKINIDKIGKKDYSTKEIKSGIGLNYIKRIKSPKIKVEFKIINDLFISKIKYKKSTR